MDKPFFQLGILGYPLSHSLSPKIHQLFLKSCGLQGQYECFEIPPESLKSWLDTVCSEQRLTGFNITIPHKVPIFPYLQGISTEVSMIGAVNTVSVSKDGLHGHNTDAYGFWKPLENLQGKGKSEPFTKTSALILGAGGASRAVAYALLRHGIKHITFWGRSQERAQGTLAYAQKIQTSLLETQGTTLDFCTELSQEHLTQSMLVVNTTPIGMMPQPLATPLSQEHLALLPPHALVYDLVYNPLETKLLKTATLLGLQTQDGLEMLIYQAAKAFELWTGEIIPEQILSNVKSQLA